jgi:hypothetical protein
MDLFCRAPATIAGCTGRQGKGKKPGKTVATLALRDRVKTNRAGGTTVLLIFRRKNDSGVTIMAEPLIGDFGR